MIDVQAYLEPLIKEAIEQARSEKIPELDAKAITPARLNQIQTVSAGQHEDIPPRVTMPSTDDESTSVNNASGSDTQAESGSQPDKHRYTSRLFQIAGENGIMPIFKNTQISTFPCAWKCRLYFGDHFEEAIAGSTKVARHEASYRLCTRIGINID